MKFKLLKNRELILYLVCGVLTTLVNFLVFILFNKLLGEENYLFNNLVAFIVAVIFAFIVNKYLVFLENKTKFKVIAKEFALFVSARIISFFFEEIGLLVFDLLGFSKILINIYTFSLSGLILAKIFLSIIVIIANYFFTKFVFKKK